MASFKTVFVRQRIDAIILEFLTDGNTEQYENLDEYLWTKSKENTNSESTLEDLIPVISKLSSEHSATVDKLDGMYGAIKSVAADPQTLYPLPQKKPLPKIEEPDINIVMSQTGSSHFSAYYALVKNDGDIVNAIMELTSEKELNPPSKESLLKNDKKWEELWEMIREPDDRINEEVSDEEVSDEEEFGITI